MKDTTQRILRFMYAALALTICLLMLFINRSLASFAGWLYPAAELWTHIGLAALEALAIALLWRALFGGKRHLLLPDGDSAEEERRFAEELTRRMRENSHIQAAGILPQGPEEKKGVPDAAYLDQCLTLLNSKADTETERCARRIFLATALSQNGRLDALIVFLSLCGLIWRISSLYNQRPHPREIASIYRAVATSAFLAFSFDELDLSTEITVGFGEAFHAMAPAGLTSGLPFVGKTLQTLTASTIDGAANCYLALRTGIITRNAYAYGARKAERPSRAAVFKEAGSLLLGMSQALVEKLASTVASNVVGIARLAGGRTARMGKELAEGIGQAGQELGSSAGKLAAEVLYARQVSTADDPAGDAARRARLRFGNPFSRQKQK